MLPFLWAIGGDFETFKRALDDDLSIEAVSIAEEADNAVLYRLEWDDEFCELIHEMVDHHAAITEASAQEDSWSLRLRFAEEGMVSSFQDHFREVGHEFEVHSLWRPDEPRQHEYGLTSEQQEALVAAVHQDRFSLPRRASMEELGGTLGTSASAASQRIRRGCDTLIRTGLMVDPDETD